MKNKHIIIAGGSGFIGIQLAAQWAVDNKVTILTRNTHGANNSFGKTAMPANVNRVQWDGRTVWEWAHTLEGCDLLLNLAGRSVNCRYNAKNKAEILNSRIDATQALGEAIATLQQPPALWINCASATIYRHAEDHPQDEYTGEPGSGFSVEVCRAWEAAFNDIALPATRKIVLRMAIVLGNGGVLVPYSALARLGVGGRQGSGRQMFSWVHIADVAAIIAWLQADGSHSGAYNVSAPAPVTNREFMRLLRNIYHMPIGIPAPEWLLKIAAAIQGTETELLLKSRWVAPSRLLAEGYTFRFSQLAPSLDNLLASRPHIKI